MLLESLTIPLICKCSTVSLHVAHLNSYRPDIQYFPFSSDAKLQTHTITQNPPLKSKTSKQNMNNHLPFQYFPQ